MAPAVRAVPRRAAAVRCTARRCKQEQRQQQQRPLHSGQAPTWVGAQLRHLGLHAGAVCDAEFHDGSGRHHWRSCCCRGAAAGGHLDRLVLARQGHQLQARHDGCLGLRCCHRCRRWRGLEPHQHCICCILRCVLGQAVDRWGAAGGCCRRGCCGGRCDPLCGGCGAGGGRPSRRGLHQARRYETCNACRGGAWAQAGGASGRRKGALAWLGSWVLDSWRTPRRSPTTTHARINV